MDTNYPNKLDNTLTKRLICKIAFTLLTIILLTAPQLYGQDDFTATCYYSSDTSDLDYDYSNSITKNFTSLEEAMTPANYYDEKNNRYARVVYIKQNSDSYDLNTKIDNIGCIGNQVDNVRKYILELKTINCSGDAEIVVNDADVYLNNITANGLVKFKMYSGHPIYICGGNFNGGVEINGPDESQITTSITNVNAYIFGGSFKGTDYAIRIIDNVNLYIENSQEKNGGLVSPTFTATNGPALINNNSTGMVYIYGGKFIGSNGNSAIISKQNTKVLGSQTGLKLLDASDVPHEEQYKNNNNYYELCDETSDKLSKVTVAGSYLEFNNNDGSLTFKYGERLRGWRAWNKLIQATAREVFDLGYLNNLPPKNGIYFDINDIEKENNRDKKNSSGKIEWRWEVVKKVQFDNGYTSNVHPTTCAYWFKDFTSLTTIDLRSLNTDNLTDMSHMFDGCSSLTTILVPDDWATNSEAVGDKMFDGCTKLIGNKGTTYNASNANNISFAIIDGGDNSPGYLSDGIYTISYIHKDQNGETINITLDNNYPTKYTYDDNDITINKPTQMPDYSFKEWKYTISTDKTTIIPVEGNSIIIPQNSVGNYEITITWDIESYSVTLPENMEFVPESTDNKFEYKSTVTFKAKDGYKVTEGPSLSTPRIEGFSITQDKDNQYQYSFTMPSAPDGVKIEATVVEKPKFTVSFVTEYGTAPAQQIVIEDGKVQIPDFTNQQPAYEFKGWKTSDGELYNFDTPVTSSFTLTADWQKAPFKINPTLSEADKHISFPKDWKQFCKKQETYAELSYSITGGGEPTSCHITIESIEGSREYPANNGKVKITTLPSFPGEYACTAVFTGDEESTTPSDTIKFTLEITAARGLILQLYKNVIFVNNSSEKFETYQWYRYGEETDEKLKNGERQYFTEPTLKGSYWALLNGKIHACYMEDQPVIVKQAEVSISTYPNPAVEGEQFTIEINNFDPDTEYSMIISNSNGNIIKQLTVTKQQTTLSLPRGFYTGALMWSGNKQSFKIIVR